MTAGRVTVNGKVVTELGFKVDPLNDVVTIDGAQILFLQGHTYLMLNKPAGYLTTMLDPQGRPTIKELVPIAKHPGLFPVGRLDFDTVGLLFFTTDGELAHRLLHPRHHVQKTYIAKVDGVLTKADIKRLQQGVLLHDGMTAPAKVCLLEATGSPLQNQCHFKQLKKPNTNERMAHFSGKLPIVTSTASITITEGRKRQVKRMFAHVGRPVLSLKRISFGTLELGDLPQGQYRYLTDDEISALREAGQFC
jgi:23S rRNA pseudouridine2605 synthase